MKRLLVICGMWVFLVIFWGSLITGLYFMTNYAVSSTTGFEHGLFTRFLAGLSGAGVTLASLLTIAAYHLTKCLATDE